MIEEGLILMLSGMGVVFLFLTTMVLVMYGTSAIIRRFDKTPPPNKPVKKASHTAKKTETKKLEGDKKENTAESNEKLCRIQNAVC